MATFTMKPHAGLTTGRLAQVKDKIPNLVARTAAGVSWNHLGSAPKNFGSKQVGNQIKSIHEASGVEFKAGFQMLQENGQQKWEGQAVDGETRLDLQGIENNWANFAIQMKEKGGGSVTVATCLMQVNMCFSQRHLVHGLLESAKSGQVCELTS